MIIALTAIAFVLFVAWVESYRLSLIARDWIKSINSTFGRAKWVYSNTKQHQTWMRTNTIKSYKCQS